MPDFQLILPLLVKNRGSIGVGANDISVQDVRALQKRLKEIEPELRTMLVREAKGVGREAQTLIKNAIPKTTPLWATNSRGRLSWDYQQNKNGFVAADHTLVQFRTSVGSMSRKLGKSTTSLVRVKVDAPMTVIADIAGRSGRAIGRGYKGSGYSRPFVRNGSVVRMRINGQGVGMIGKLDRSLGRPSRFVYPSIEGGRARWEAEIKQILKKYEAIANRKFS